MRWAGMRSAKCVLRLSRLLFPLSFAACADVDALAEGRGAALEEAPVTSIEITRTAGPVVVEPGGCAESRRLEVDFVRARVSGGGCVEDDPIVLERPLTMRELDRVRAALAGVDAAPPLPSCTTDIPFTVLTVRRGGISVRYVEREAACEGDVAADGLALRAVLGAVERAALLPPMRERHDEAVGR